MCVRVRDLRACEHIQSSETPDANDGNKLAEKPLELDGLRPIAVVETEPSMRSRSSALPGT